MTPDSPEEIRWFSDEVTPHEPALKAYLRGSFPSLRDVDDVVQESYLRIIRARLAQPIVSAKGLLFQIARHIAIDGVRRDRVSPIDRQSDAASVAVVEESPDAAERLGRQEKVKLLAQAIFALGEPCREVVMLRKLQEVPQKEIALRLGLTEKAVESHVQRGMKRCEEFLRRRGVQSFYDDGPR